MGNSYKFLAGLIFGISSLSACKLDPPIFPKDTGAAIGTTGTTGITGITGATGTTGKTDTTDKAFFTGDWFCENDKTETYTQTGQLLSSVNANAFYYSILFSADKNFAGFKLTIEDSPGPQYYNYTTYDVNGQTYVDFDADPFFRSANKPIELVSQSTNEMVWLIIDPRLHNTNGIYTYTADRLFLVKVQ
ncbi:hypothetical protein [Mucilaginibacter sp. dw_454]|uniref:hypothetical protein n=1 Tax=Mucilaginibacter sp. dw_454 TaxID=2720079 RepID=UPI001BD3ECAC|nr:hypothetical protein [Mucilaginibacter sp. dw_454]